MLVLCLLWYMVYVLFVYHTTNDSIIWSQVDGHLIKKITDELKGKRIVWFLKQVWWNSQNRFHELYIPLSLVEIIANIIYLKK